MSISFTDCCWISSIRAFLPDHWPEILGLKIGASQSRKEDSGDALKVRLAINPISLTIVLCVHKTRTCEVGSVSNRSLAFAWCVLINRCNRCGLCHVQRSGFCEAACTRGNLEQRVVSLVCICGDQLHKKLGLRWICCGWVLGGSFPVDDTAWPVIEGRPPTSTGTIVEAGERLDPAAGLVVFYAGLPLFHSPPPPYTHQGVRIFPVLSYIPVYGNKTTARRL